MKRLFKNGVSRLFLAAFLATTVSSGPLLATANFGSKLLTFSKSFYKLNPRLYPEIASSTLRYTNTHDHAYFYKTNYAKVFKLFPYPGQAVMGSCEVGGGKYASQTFDGVKGLMLIEECFNSRNSGKTIFDRNGVDEYDPDISQTKVQAQNNFVMKSIKKVLANKDKDHFSLSNSFVTSRDDGEAHGWISMQHRSPGSEEVQEIILHVNLPGCKSDLQKLFVGQLGVNLLFAYRDLSHDPALFFSALIEDLPVDALGDPVVQIDDIQFSGPGFEGLRDAVTPENMIASGLSNYVLFEKTSGKIKSVHSLSVSEREEIIPACKDLGSFCQGPDSCSLEIGENYSLLVRAPEYTGKNAKKADIFHLLNFKKNLAIKPKESKRALVDYSSLRSQAEKKESHHRKSTLLNVDSFAKIRTLEISEFGGSYLANTHFENAFGSSYIDQASGYTLAHAASEFGLSVEEFSEAPLEAMAILSKENFLKIDLPESQRSEVKKGAITTLRVNNKGYVYFLSEKKPGGETYSIFLSCEFSEGLDRNLKKRYIAELALNIKSHFHLGVSEKSLAAEVREDIPPEDVYNITISVR